ncbi:MFS transporter [Limoniibacter endophyticus]|nr:MFS transporter [Limoniibacter endophyticus]
MLASTLLALTQGFGMNLVTANIPQIQGAIGATNIETTWLMAAYMAPNVSLAIALIKLRTQFGLRNFAELSILVFCIVSIFNLFVTDLQSAIVVRFFSGVAAAPMSSLAFLYMLEPFPPQKKLTIGLSLALTNIALGPSIARMISPILLDAGGFHALTLFELGLAMLAFCAVYLLPLTPQLRANVIEKLDVISYFLIATGFGCVAVVLVMGRLHWWFEAPWIGYALLCAAVTITVAIIIELNRKNPLIDIRWIFSPAVLHLTGALLLFRLILAEQTTGAGGFLQVIGLQNDQTFLLYFLIFLSTIAGGLVCARLMGAGREPYFHIVALSLLAIGAFIDSSATNLTRPQNMYLSQIMIGFAAAIFLPPAMATGLMSALKKGPNYILSFIIVFLTTQSLGGLLGSAVFGTFITLREKFHSNALVEKIALTDPLVVQRVKALAAPYAPHLTDQAVLNAEGIAMLSQQATREANVLAYNDAFFVMGCMASAALFVLLCHVAFDAVKKQTRKQDGENTAGVTAS